MSPDVDPCAGEPTRPAPTPSDHELAEHLAHLSSTYGGTPTRQAAALAKVLADLDRCPHGRHEGDTCAGYQPGRAMSGCRGGISRGNPLLPTGARVGNDLYGHPYWMPPRGLRHIAQEWQRPPAAAVITVTVHSSRGLRIAAGAFNDVIGKRVPLKVAGRITHCGLLLSAVVRDGGDAAVLTLEVPPELALPDVPDVQIAMASEAVPVRGVEADTTMGQEAGSADLWLAYGGTYVLAFNGPHLVDERPAGRPS